MGDFFSLHQEGNSVATRGTLAKTPPLPESGGNIKGVVVVLLSTKAARTPKKPSGWL